MSVALIDTFGDVAATCWPVLCRVFLVCGGLVALTGTSWWLAERAWQRWQRHRRALAGLMDAGDGQGGIPATGQLVAVPAMELVGICPEFCDNLAEVGDPGDCGCGGPCGRAWCPRKRNPVPVTWTEREEGVR